MTLETARNEAAGQLMIADRENIDAWIMGDSVDRIHWE